MPLSGFDPSVAKALTQGNQSGGNPAAMQSTARVFGSNEEAAKAWGLSLGYPVPNKLNGCLGTAGVMLGLIAGVFPGILLIIIILVKDRDYKREMRALVAKWVDAGRPEPGMATAPLQALEEVAEEESTRTGPPPLGLEEQLRELQSMREKELITPEEYQALRKKALGL